MCVSYKITRSFISLKYQAMWTLRSFLFVEWRVIVCIYHLEPRSQHCIGDINNSCRLRVIAETIFADFFSILDELFITEYCIKSFLFLVHFYTMTPKIVAFIFFSYFLSRGRVYKKYLWNKAVYTSDILSISTWSNIFTFLIVKIQAKVQPVNWIVINDRFSHETSQHSSPRAISWY